MFKFHKKSAFTLVELIIVIAILAILGVSTTLILMKWFDKSKDTKRASDMNVMMAALETQLNTALEYTIPDDYIEITAGSEVIAYQGNFGTIASKNTGISHELSDPETYAPYVYGVSKNKDKYQLMVFMGEEKYGRSYLGDRSYAQLFSGANLDSKFPYTKGYKLGLFLESGTNIPVHDIQLSLDITNVITGFNVYFSNDNVELLSGNLLTYFSSFRPELSSIDSTLEAYFPLDEGKRSTSEDVTGNGYDLTFYGDNGLPEWIDGIDYKGLRFDGVDDYAMINGSINLGKTYSISMWVRSLDISSNVRLIARSNDIAQTPIGLSYSTNQIITTDNNETYGIAFADWKQNKWQHFAMTRDNQFVKMYVDGKKVGEISFTSNNNVTVDNIGALYNSLTSEIFKGIIDEVRMYNVPLSDSEISALYNGQK